MNRKRLSIGELTASITEVLSHYSDQSYFNEARVESLKASVTQLKTQLGSANTQIQRDHYGEFIKVILAGQSLVNLVGGLHHLDYESRRSMLQLITALAHRSVNGDVTDAVHMIPLVNYIHSHQDILDVLLDGYALPQPFHITTILKEYTGIYSIAEILLRFCAKEEFQRLFMAMGNPNFDISSDASIVLKDLLTKHEQLTATFLEETPEFFVWFRTLLHSSNYATRRFSINLLSTLLLNRSNFAAMSHFVESDEHLKIVMRLLKDDSMAIRFEAFHVFKVFVANPKKTASILKILKRNKERLVEHLLGFTTEANAADFEEEKGFIVDSISAL